MDISAFLALVLDTVKDFGGLPVLMKISAVITVLVSSLKVAPITRVLWSRLGWAQVLVAPVLGLLAGVLALGATGTPVTPALLFAYVTAGGGAVFLHELLDGLKGAPGIGHVYVTAIDWIEALLTPSAVKRPAAPVAAGAARGMPAPESKAGHPTLDDRMGSGKFI